MASDMFSDARRIILETIHRHSTLREDVRQELCRRLYACDFAPEEFERIIAHLRAHPGCCSDLSCSDLL